MATGDSGAGRDGDQLARMLRSVAINLIGVAVAAAFAIAVKAQIDLSVAQNDIAALKEAMRETKARVERLETWRR